MCTMCTMIVFHSLYRCSALEYLVKGLSFCTWADTSTIRPHCCLNCATLIFKSVFKSVFTPIIVLTTASVLREQKQHTLGHYSPLPFPSGKARGLNGPPLTSVPEMHWDAIRPIFLTIYCLTKNHSLEQPFTQLAINIFITKYSTPSTTLRPARIFHCLYTDWCPGTASSF